MQEGIWALLLCKYCAYPYLRKVYSLKNPIVVGIRGRKIGIVYSRLTESCIRHKTLVRPRFEGNISGQCIHGLVEKVLANTKANTEVPKNDRKSRSGKGLGANTKANTKREGGILKKSFKVITIRLPSDHPIFQIKPGSRSEVARSWLAIGARLEQLDDKISRLDEKITGAAKLPNADREDARPKQNNGFDKEAFLKYFG